MDFGQVFPRCSPEDLLVLECAVVQNATSFVKQFSPDLPSGVLCDAGSERNGLLELHAQLPLAARTIEQDRVPLALPNRCQLDAPRSMQAEVNATRAAPAEQNPFCHVEGPDLELILFAYSSVHVRSQTS
jgi:hypothetical protein